MHEMPGFYDPRTIRELQENTDSHDSVERRCLNYREGGDPLAWVQRITGSTGPYQSRTRGR